MLKFRMIGAKLIDIQIRRVGPLLSTTKATSTTTTSSPPHTIAHKSTNSTSIIHPSTTSATTTTHPPTHVHAHINSNFAGKVIFNLFT